ncbi:MAG: hypothetical protein QUU85_09310, partial [Candidatus Eisenbacteria bacterium]|nr:hypothetical protein [Candidatus Eisenbacteria bacterium]
MFRPILRAFTRALTRAFTGAFTSAFTSAFTRVSEDGRAPRCAARCATSSATRVPLAWLLLPLLAALPASGGAADLRAGVHPLLRRALTVPSEGIPVALRSQDAPSSICLLYTSD